jgi:hypothetical protein
MSRPLDDDEDYFVPLEDQRVFGAGIKRKRVPFVRPSTESTLSTTTLPEASESQISVADQYLAIVMSKKQKKVLDTPPEKTKEDDQSNRMGRETVSTPPSPTASSPKRDLEEQKPYSKVADSITTQTQRCEVCHLPLTTNKIGNDSTVGNRVVRLRSTPHEASLAHQVCLTHSHPPSHLDRTRHGMRYLASYGWDPDNRLGLGAAGREGIREPIKPKAKNDTTGLGMKIDENALAAKQKIQQQRQEQRNKLNAKQVRLGAMADRKKGDQLRELFYGSDDIQRYLGGT